MQNSDGEEWQEVGEKHPADGVVAHSYKWFRHSDRSEIVIWSDVAEGGRYYDVGEDTEYVVEVYDSTGDIIDGDSFETREAAESDARDKMAQYPA